MLRKLIAQHIFVVKRFNLDRFYEEQYRVRRDFDKIFNNPNATQMEIDTMLEKYELYIEHNFEPYAALHECRPHSNLWGKMVLWHDDALASDHIGYYSKDVLVDALPSAGNFHEEYPHQVQAWMYDDNYVNTDFNYEEMEAKYLKQQHDQPANPSALKKELDGQHKSM